MEEEAQNKKFAIGVRRTMSRTAKMNTARKKRGCKEDIAGNSGREAHLPPDLPNTRVKHIARRQQHHYNQSFYNLKIKYPLLAFNVHTALRNNAPQRQLRLKHVSIPTQPYCTPSFPTILLKLATGLQGESIDAKHQPS